MKNSLTKFQENAHLCKEIQWQYHDTVSNKWQSFSLYLNSTIEKAFNRNNSYVNLMFYVIILFFSDKALHI
jgi:hypothetical protein